jgi:hypothetical protein
MELVLIVLAVLLFELAAARWAYDSRDLLHNHDRVDRLDF